MPPKKTDKKEKPPGWNFDPLEGLIVLLIFVVIITRIVPAIFGYFTSGSFSFYGFKLSGIFDFVKAHMWFFRFLGFSVAGFSAFSTFVLTKATDAVWLAEKAKLFPVVTTPVAPVVHTSQHNITSTWQKILAYTESEQESNWRLAIIEADIILGDLLDSLHLPGDSIGEKLKAVEKSDFNTIEYAWEAHKARNMIAHEGSNFLLNQRETRRIIQLYGAVFKEFYLI